jgi:hypothetical protein
LADEEGGDGVRVCLQRNWSGASPNDRGEDLRTIHTSYADSTPGGGSDHRLIARRGPFQAVRELAKTGPVDTFAEGNSESNGCLRNSTPRAVGDSPFGRLAVTWD